jgi:hypothetical protein
VKTQLPDTSTRVPSCYAYFLINVSWRSEQFDTVVVISSVSGSGDQLKSLGHHSVITRLFVWSVWVSSSEYLSPPHRDLRPRQALGSSIEMIAEA